MIEIWSPFSDQKMHTQINKVNVFSAVTQSPKQQMKELRKACDYMQSDIWDKQRSCLNSSYDLLVLPVLMYMNKKKTN